jgi:hypothetical protein
VRFGDTTQQYGSEKFFTGVTILDVSCDSQFTHFY